jgi:hypothetical protein
MKNTEKKEGKDMENMAENSEKIWKIQKKDKLYSEKIGKIWRKGKLNSEKMKHMEESQVE